MSIKDKLIIDKKKLSGDIDSVIEKLNEYEQTIDKLAKQMEIAKDSFEWFIEQYEFADYPISDEFAKEALEKIKKIETE